MKQMSLVEICNKYGLSRRAIQGYEKEGLVKPTGKTKYGYLLYDENNISRILFIKHLQNMGFTIKQISSFIDDKKDVIRAKIEQQIPMLESDKIEISRLISDSKRIIKLLNDKELEEVMFKITMEERK